MPDLVCLIKGHKVCYCNCGLNLTHCCGCGGKRSAVVQFLHCQECKEDLSSYLKDVELHDNGQRNKILKSLGR